MRRDFRCIHSSAFPQTYRAETLIWREFHEGKGFVNSVPAEHVIGKPAAVI
jgi:hypothetical protein